MYLASPPVFKPFKTPQNSGKNMGLFLYVLTSTKLNLYIIFIQALTFMQSFIQSFIQLFVHFCPPLPRLFRIHRKQTSFFRSFKFPALCSLLLEQEHYVGGETATDSLTMLIQLNAVPKRIKLQKRA